MTADWYSEENLQQAWKYANSDIRDDFVFDPINHDDIKHNLSIILPSLHAQIKSNQYYPAPLVRISVPKNYHSVRPGTVIPLIDLIVLYAIGQQLAPLLDPFLSDSAYAYRLNPKAGKSGQHLFKPKDIPEPDKEDEDKADNSLSDNQNEEDNPDADFPYNWFVNWKAFYDNSKKASETYEFVAVTDITAYFENISLGMLRDILKEKLNSNQRELIDRLFRLFELWSWTPDGNLPHGIGLLQGNDVSSFLSNLYLLALDEAMLKIVGGDFSKYYRYVDDVKLFTSDQGEARRALVELEHVLRALNLNVQSAKTKILPANEIFDHDVEKWLHKMRDDDPERTTHAIQFYKTDFDINDLGKWQRPYSRCLTILQKANNDSAVDNVLNLFLDNPTYRLLGKNFKYLKHFVTTHNYGEKIAERLASNTFTFPYHQAYMYRLAAYTRDNVAELKNLALKEAINPNSHWFCRVAALFCLSTFSLEGKELSQIGSLLNLEANSQVLRACFTVLVQHSGQELEWVLDKLTLFNAPHQNYLRRYFSQLYQDNKVGVSYVTKVRGASIQAPNFVHNLYKLDILKARTDREQRTIFKEMIEQKIKDSNENEWPRLTERLGKIYESFVVRA